MNKLASIKSNLTKRKLTGTAIINEVADYTFKVKATTTTFPTTDVCGNPLTNTNNVVLYNDITRGYVFNLSGANYLTINNPTPINFSRTLWISSTSPITSYGNVFSSAKFPILFNQTTLLKFIANWGGTNTALTSNITQTSTWVFYALTVTATNMTLYINGSQTATASGDTANTQFGNYSGGTNYFTGYLDDMRMYPYALTASQINNIGR